MASLVTIVLFFVYLWGFGFSATYFLKQSEDWLERTIINGAVGLGILPIFSILLNFLQVPLDWKIFLAASMALPLYVLMKKSIKGELKRPSFELKLTRSQVALGLVLLISLFSLWMYSKGAFSYPYLEDEDPWGHAVGAKYVAIEKNAYDPKLPHFPEKVDEVLSYIDPYPPAYNILMGILHQTSPDLTWTIKFFNALIISIGILFFYLFAKEFTKNRWIALFATFIFANVPSYLSHFIWAHALAVTLIFPAMFALEKAREDKKWYLIAALLIASIWVSQNIEQPIKLTTMILIYAIVSSIADRRILKECYVAVFGGIALSFLWWGPMIQKYSLSGFFGYYGGPRVVAGDTIILQNESGSLSILTILKSAIQAITNPGGTGSRAYTLSDFLIAKTDNMINNPIGIGILISVLTLIGVIYIVWKYKSSIVTADNRWRCIALFWLIFAFWGVNGMTFPISVAKGAFRTWMLLAIPISLIAADTGIGLAQYFKSTRIKATFILLLILAIAATSGYQKYTLNTAIWPTSGSFSSPAEAFEYGNWFKTLPPETKVFLYAPRDKVVVGFGKFACAWCDDVLYFRQDILNRNATELYDFLKERQYEYLLINGRMDSKYFAKTFGENDTAVLLPKRYEEIFGSGLFLPTYQKEGIFIALRLR